MLSKKWLSSTFCRAEAAWALALRKPIYVVLPQMSKSQTVGCVLFLFSDSVSFLWNVVDGTNH